VKTWLKRGWARIGSFGRALAVCAPLIATTPGGWPFLVALVTAWAMYALGHVEGVDHGIGVGVKHAMESNEVREKIAGSQRYRERMERAKWN